MAVNITLLTNLTTFDELHKLANKAGKTTKIDIRILQRLLDTEVLQRLLIDHSVMYRTIRENSSIQIKEPKNREKI